MSEEGPGRKYDAIFRHSAVSLWVEDVSALRAELDGLRAAGVSEIEGYLARHPDLVRKAAELITVVDLNDATVHLYGVRTREELLGPLSKTLDLDDRKTFDSLAQDIGALFDGRPHPVRESRAVTPGGRRIDVMLYTSVLPEPNERSLVLVSVIDLTEQRRIERSRFESEERFRSVAEVSVHPIIILDESGAITYWNDAAHRVFGYSSGEAVGKPGASFVPRETLARLREAILRTRAEINAPLRVGPIEGIAVSQGGRRIAVELSLAQWTLEGHSYYTILSRDITARKLAEERLQQQAKLLDIASDAIVVIDVERKIRYWNRSAERMFGWSSEEAIGRTQEELLCSPDHHGELNRSQQIAFTRGQWSGESHYATKTGKVLIGDTRLTVVRDEEGTPSGLLAVTTDTTDRRALERELLRYQRIESIGTLAAGVAHDLNNVLAPIVTGVEALEMDREGATAKGILQIVKTSALRGASIIRQLLDFARGVEGGRSSVNVAAVVADIREVITETFPKSIRLEIDVAAILWPITGDATQIHQVLMNLCLNARDAMPAGGTLALRVENETLDDANAITHVEARPGPYVVLHVEDTGVGMEPVVLERIFDPFFTTKDTGKGTGLGLSTTLSIVRSHGGFMTVYSEPNLGTSFRVYLPVDGGGIAILGDNKSQDLPPGSGEMILVADDEEAVLQTTRQVLEANGYRVTTVADGAHLLAAFAQLRDEVQLVLTDVLMPYLDGPSAIRAIRRIDPQVPIVVTSGLSASRNSLQFRDVEVDAVLLKPFTSSSLLQTLHQVLHDPKKMRE